jgi:erythromycin esterase
VAAPAWTRLTTAEQDALSAILMRLLLRFRAVEPRYVSRGDQRGYDIARRCLEGACHADYGFRAMADLFAGNGLTADTSTRDVYMAESVRWHLDRSAPDARVALVEPLLPGFSREIIRITPTKIVSWGLDGPRASRTVWAPSAGGTGG